MRCHSLWSLITVIFCWNRRRHNCGPMTLKWFPWISNPTYMVDLSSGKLKYLFMVAWKSPGVLTQSCCCGRRNPALLSPRPHPIEATAQPLTGSQNFLRWPSWSKQTRRYSTETLDSLSWGPASFSLRVFCPKTAAVYSDVWHLFFFFFLHLELSEWLMLLARVLSSRIQGIYMPRCTSIF